MSSLIKVFQQKQTKIPIWLMRQAGRYLPEYRSIRNTVNTFLELCYDTKKATTVTLQPINRFGLDAAIIFSDILVVPDALGWNISFDNFKGPVVELFDSDKDLFKINDNFSSKIYNIYDMIRNVRDTLPKDVSIIGFAGSPWTVISYMLEGSTVTSKKQNFLRSKSFLLNNPKTSLELFDIISEKTIEHLSGQIEAGAEIIQLFDSWSGMLSGSSYEEFVIRPTKKIVKQLKAKYKHIPIIGFPRGSGYNYEKYIKNTNIDGVSADQFVPVSQMKKWQKQLVVQGNLDPIVLFSNKEQIKNAIDKILYQMEDFNFIFNLGHGIIPNTMLENVEYLVDYVKKFKK